MVDQAELLGSVGLEALRTTHRLTAIYNEALQPVGLTIHQFGLLAHLYGAKLDGRLRLPMFVLAEFSGVAASSLWRHLKPLARKRWVLRAIDKADRRKRTVSITASGCLQLERAARYWRCAQERTQHALGAENAGALRSVLDLALLRLMKPI